MRTVGEILKKARLEKRISYEEVEKQLKIRKKFLIALEDNSWDKLPSIPYVKGFLRNYSIFLGLKPEEMTAIFRRQFRSQEKAGLLPESLSHPIDEPVVRFTPHIAAIATIGAFIIFFFGYLFYQYSLYTSPPNLMVSRPQEGEIISSDKITVTGKTDADAVISINGQKIALNQKGEFSTIITLSPGVNSIIVESVSKFGKKKVITRTIQIQST